MKAVLRNVVALLLTGMFTLMVAPVASADTVVCSGSIVDQTDGHVLMSQQTRVQSAIDDASSYGADVYVRAFQNTPGGDADTFWRQGLAQCPNWSTPDGHTKSNVVVVVLGMDHKSAIYFNNEHYPALKSRADTIRSQDMNANFKKGNFADGVVAGLNSIKAATQPGASTDDGPSAGTILKWIGAIIGIIVGIVLLGFGGFWLYSTWRERREAEEVRLDAQAKARKAKADASSEVTNARSDEDLKREFLMATAGLPKVMTDKHYETFEAIDVSSDTQVEAFANLNEDPAFDPEGVLKTADYAAQQKRYGAIATALQSVASQYETLFATIKNDKRDLTPEARTRRWNDINDDVFRLQTVLGDCERVFDVASQRTQLTELVSQVQVAQALLANVQELETVTSYDQLIGLERQLGDLTSQVAKLTADRDTVDGARKSFQSEVASRRKRLGKVQHVSASSALSDLEQVEGRIDERVKGLQSIRSREQLLESIGQFRDQIKQVGHKVVTEDDRIEAEAEAARRRKREQEEAERRRKREREEEEERARRRSSSYGSSGGGYIYTDSGSSSGGCSSSSVDGGSSGGW